MANETKEPKRLYLSKKHRVFAGVAGGIGEYLDIDPVLIRVAFVLLTLFDGLGVVLYIVLMIAVPEQTDGEGPAKKEATGGLAHEISESAREGLDKIKKKEWSSSSGRDFIGGVIVLLGIVLLLDQFLPRLGLNWDILWPLILILLGVYLLVKRK